MALVNTSPARQREAPVHNLASTFGGRIHPGQGVGSLCVTARQTRLAPRRKLGNLTVWGSKVDRSAKLKVISIQHNTGGTAVLEGCAKRYGKH